MFNSTKQFSASMNGFSKCNGLFEDFIFQYDSRPLDSGISYRMWELFMMYDAIREVVNDLYKENLDLTQEGLLKPDFVERRKQEYTTFFVSKLPRDMKCCIDLILSFNASVIRATNNSKTFFLTGKTVARFARKSEANCRLLKRSLESWVDKLEIEVPDVRTGVQNRLIEKKNDHWGRYGSLRHIQTFTALVLSDYQVSTVKKVEKYLPIIRDIYECLENEVVKKVIVAAEKMLKIKVAGNKHIQAGSQPQSSISSLNASDTFETRLAESGFTTLDPFSINTIPGEERLLYKIDFDQDTGMFCCTLPKGSRGAKETYELEAVVSDIAPVTVKRDTKKHLRIPDDATRFGFVYPAALRKKKNCATQEHKWKTSNCFANEKSQELKLLLTIGGYIYFNERMEVRHLTGLGTGGEDLYFSGPFPIDESGDDGERLRALERGNKMHTITVEALNDLGARKFAWFKPCAFGKHNDGGFIYKCQIRDSEHFFFQYFIVSDVKTGRLMNELNKSSTGSTRMSKDKLKKSWETFEIENREEFK